ncbi:MAG: transglutaminase-like domain-containing protein [Spirochaetaceae bacterium]|nr:transglutaminase-like domain-containing protein [Spirochaetaceae bacterium]
MKERPGKLTLLFLTRLSLYLAVFSLPLIHPGVSVAYDRSGLVLWFGVVPLLAGIAFWKGPRPGVVKNRRLAWMKKHLRLILAGAILLAGSLAGPGLNTEALPGLGAGCLSFFITTILFRFPRWGKAAIAEQIFFAFISFRMLGFSRSSEEVAAESSALTQGILIFTLAAFLVHGMVIYYCLFRAAEGGGKRRREAGAFALAAALAVFLLIVILPSDFVKNSVISNLLQDKVDPEPVPIDEEGDGMPGGNLRSRRNRPLFPRGGGERGTNRLEGIPESQWPGPGSGMGEDDGDGSSENGEGRSRGKGRGQTKQYAVMVVAAKTSPVYAAASYRGELHPLRGFLPTKDEPLNKLPTTRLLETWKNTSFNYESGRSEEEIFFLSTLPEKYLPYNPFAVEPTILQTGYGPFRYSHAVRSAISRTGAERLRGVREISSRETQRHAEFLEVELAKNDQVIFEAHLAGALQEARAEGEGESYFGRLLAVLKSFSSFQYTAGFSGDTTIPALVDFLTYTKEGDCTEFSNTAAILGRLAGIPARVVTGFLVDEGLQTPAHLRGLAVLRGQIKLLQEFPPEELFLVTTAHRHSWVQFWLPAYGWIDFEATAFAIPPMGLGDANNRDVVIPIFEKEQPITPLRSFPWRPVLRGLGILLAAAAAGAYILRYGREAFLALRARKGGDRASRALYGLLLMRLAAEGKPIKTPAQTSREYSCLFPDDPALIVFAALYTQLRYRASADDERQKVYAALGDEYRKILKSQRRGGIAGWFLRIFSLRGLAYL